MGISCLIGLDNVGTGPTKRREALAAGQEPALSRAAQPVARSSGAALRRSGADTVEARGTTLESDATAGVGGWTRELPEISS